MRETDKIMILTTLLLVVAGIIMVYSSSYIVAMERYDNEYLFLRKHLFFTAVGLVSFIGGMYIPYRVYRRVTYPLLILSLILLSLVFINGVGFEVGGARRWVSLGPVNFQPSEVAKLAVVIFLAYSLEAKQKSIKSFSPGFLPHIVIPALPVLLILVEPDFGTAMVLAAVAFIMMFTGGVRLAYLMTLVMLALPFLYYMVMNAGYRVKRMLAFLDPWKDPDGAGFQMVQSFLALGSGGIFGAGLGEGRQKLFFLPEAHTDFILSILGEELGFIGVVVVICLFILFLLCGIKIALKAPDLFGTYLAVGLTSLVILQAVINMGVVMGLLPPKGLPLPFISYGGTSLVVNMTVAGILLNIYKRGCEV
ncbi:MAG: putative lipid II flippase FtsW [Thermodesulfobacteriota bacterium]